MLSAIITTTSKKSTVKVSDCLLLKCVVRSIVAKLHCSCGPIQLLAVPPHRSWAVITLAYDFLQVSCIPPTLRLVTVGLPVKAAAIPFLTQKNIITKSLRLNCECSSDASSHMWQQCGVQGR